MRTPSKNKKINHVYLLFSIVLEGPGSEEGEGEERKGKGKGRAEKEREKNRGEGYLGLTVYL